MRFHLHYALQAMMLLSLSHGLIASGANRTPATTFERSARLLLPSGTAPATGITNFNSLAAGNLLPSTPAPASISNPGNLGWDFAITLVSGGNTSMSAQGNGANPGGTSDISVRMNGLVGVFVKTGGAKSNDQSTFKLQYAYLKVNLTTGAPANMTITGYKANAPVAGATLTVNGIATQTWAKFDVSANANFNNVDEFRFSQAVTTSATISFMVIDEISIAAALPLTLTDFSGHREGNDALLDWTTATEQNTSSFEVQRATDGSTYTPIGEVPAAGNSTTPLHYNFIDAAPPAGTNSLFYRLKSIDLDGKFTLSPVLRIGAALPTLALSAYPNPFRQQVGISLTSPAENKATITLRDLASRILLIKDLTIQKGSNLISIPSSPQLGKGTYLLTIATGRQQQTINLVKTD